MSSQIWCYGGGEGRGRGGEWEGVVWGQNIKVAQSDLKHFLVLEFLKSDEIFKIL